MSSTIIRPYSAYDKLKCLETFKSNVPDFFTEEEISDFENFLDQFEIRNASRDPLARTFFLCGGVGW